MIDCIARDIQKLGRHVRPLLCLDVSMLTRLIPAESMTVMHGGLERFSQMGSGLVNPWKQLDW